MNNQENNDTLIEKEKRMLPFFVEFVKFSIEFVVILAAALITMHVASAAMTP